MAYVGTLHRQHSFEMGFRMQRLRCHKVRYALKVACICADAHLRVDYALKLASMCADARLQPPKRFQKQCCGLNNSQGITQGSLTIPRSLKEASENIRTLQKQF